MVILYSFIILLLTGFVKPFWEKKKSEKSLCTCAKTHVMVLVIVTKFIDCIYITR